MLGAVGAYGWSGGAFVHGGSGDTTFVNVSRDAGDMDDAYLGKGCLGRGRVVPTGVPGAVASRGSWGRWWPGEVLQMLVAP